MLSWNGPAVFPTLGLMRDDSYDGLFSRVRDIGLILSFSSESLVDDFFLSFFCESVLKESVSMITSLSLSLLTVFLRGDELKAFVRLIVDCFRVVCCVLRLNNLSRVSSLIYLMSMSCTLNRSSTRFISSLIKSDSSLTSVSISSTLQLKKNCISRGSRFLSNYISRSSSSSCHQRRVILFEI